ncbi:MAG: hypothetical protein WBP57_01065 [Ignavibacteria bacterium]
MKTFKFFIFTGIFYNPYTPKSIIENFDSTTMRKIDCLIEIFRIRLFAGINEDEIKLFVFVG